MRLIPLEEQPEEGAGRQVLLHRLERDLAEAPTLQKQLKIVCER
jgi:hypothetical protein